MCSYCTCSKNYCGRHQGHGNIYRIQFFVQAFAPALWEKICLLLSFASAALSKLKRKAIVEKKKMALHSQIFQESVTDSVFCCLLFTKRMRPRSAYCIGNITLLRCTLSLCGFLYCVNPSYSLVSMRKEKRIYRRFKYMSAPTENSNKLSSGRALPLTSNVSIPCATQELMPKTYNHLLVGFIHCCLLSAATSGAFGFLKSVIRCSRNTRNTKARGDMYIKVIVII